MSSTDNVGRNVVDNFETAIRRMNKTKGVIVAFSFGSGAHAEVAKAHNEEGLEIKLKTVEEIQGNLAITNKFAHAMKC